MSLDVNLVICAALSGQQNLLKNQNKDFIALVVTFVFFFLKRVINCAFRFLHNANKATTFSQSPEK